MQHLPRPDPRPELNTPSSYQILENTASHGASAAQFSKNTFEMTGEINEAN